MTFTVGVLEYVRNINRIRKVQEVNMKVVEFASFEEFENSKVAGEARLLR